MNRPPFTNEDNAKLRSVCGQIIGTLRGNGLPADFTPDEFIQMLIDYSIGTMRSQVAILGGAAAKGIVEGIVALSGGPRMTVLVSEYEELLRLRALHSEGP